MRDSCRSVSRCQNWTSSGSSSRAPSRNYRTAQPASCVAAGRTTIPGYLDAAQHNTVAFTADGFYRTGDLASVLDFDGRRYLSIDGRLKDLISRGGEKV